MLYCFQNSGPPDIFKNMNEGNLENDLMNVMRVQCSVHLMNVCLRYEIIFFLYFCQG